MFLDYLIPLNIVTPIICIYKFCYKESGFKLDHVFIISSGFIYFWMVPLTVYHYNLFNFIIKESHFAKTFSLRNIDLIDERCSFYLIIIFCIYISFIFGEHLSLKIKYKYLKISPFSIKPLSYVLLIYTLILGILTFETSGHYFKGYSGNIFSLQGNVIALNLMLLMLLYLEYFHSSRSINFNNIFNSWFFRIYLISSIMLASLGNRTWLICGVLSFIICYSNYYKRISKLYIILGFTFLIIIMGMIPLLRSPGGNISVKIDALDLQSIIYQAFYDPLATHNSLKHFLVQDDLQYFKLPIVLISKTFNLIPSIIMPNKEILYYTFADIGSDIISVQGSTHTFPLLMTHFGLIGSMILGFLLPFLLNYFKGSIHFMAIYVFLSAHLAAPIFRDFDNFAIKIFLQFALLMPLLYLFICGIFSSKRQI